MAKRLMEEGNFEGLKPYFPKSRGRPRVDDRKVISGIVYMLRNGLRWKDAPGE
jgi:transposase